MDRFYFLAAFSLPCLKPELVRFRGKQKGSGKLKNLRTIILVMYTVFVLLRGRSYGQNFN